MKRLILILLLFLFQLHLFGQDNFVTTFNFNECIPEIDTIDGQDIYFVVDTMPECDSLKRYNSYINLFQKYINLPNDDSVYYGLVFFTFVVDTSGNIRNECILKSILRNDILYVEEEILEALKTLDTWTIGKMDGKKVPVRMVREVKLGR